MTGEDRALRIWEKGRAPVKLDHASYKLKAKQRWVSMVSSVMSSRVDSWFCFLASGMVRRMQSSASRATLTPATGRKLMWPLWARETSLEVNPCFSMLEWDSQASSPP